MPVYEFYCNECKKHFEEVCAVGEIKSCDCGATPTRLLSAAAVVIAGNMGPKLRTRVALSDELEKLGHTAPLFKNAEHKDMSRWALKKLGIK